jgi:hypothetical protein
MTDEDYDELSTKREMVRLLAMDATDEQLDAAIHACIDNRLNDAERRTVLIETIYRSWCVRLGKRPRPPGVDFAATWEDVQRMFVDVQTAIGVPALPPKPASSDEHSGSRDMAAPRARLPVQVPEPPPQPTSSDEITELQDVAAPVARLSVATPAHGAHDESMVLEHIQHALGEPPPKPASSDEKSEYQDMAAPLRARLSLNWSRARPIR